MVDILSYYSLQTGRAQQAESRPSCSSAVYCAQSVCVYAFTVFLEIVERYVLSLWKHVLSFAEGGRRRALRQAQERLTRYSLTNAEADITVVSGTIPALEEHPAVNGHSHEEEHEVDDGVLEEAARRKGRRFRTETDRIIDE